MAKRKLLAMLKLQWGRSHKATEMQYFCAIQSMNDLLQWGRSAGTAET